MSLPPLNSHQSNKTPESHFKRPVKKNKTVAGAKMTEQILFIKLTNVKKNNALENSAYF